MVVLSNHKHEAFAQALAKGMSATDAYAEAGYRRHDGNAATMKGKPAIKRRIAELQGDAASLTAVTIGSITAELEEARQLALQSPRGASAAVAASLGKAKLHGLIVDRSHADVSVTEKLIDEMSDAELAAIIHSGFSPRSEAP